MKNSNSVKHLTYIAIFCTMALTVFLVGCQNQSPVDTDASTSAIDDAAESVAGAVGANNGGALDQVGDIATITSAAGLNNEAGALLGKYSSDSAQSTITKDYDSTTGWWTLTLSRHRTGDFGYADMNRVYRYQFLNQTGNFQKHWLAGTDTAYSIRFKIASGTGERQTQRVAHHLVSLSGEWLVTGANTRAITINSVTGGAYTRVGSDTIRSLNAVRTLNNTLTMTFTDVTTRPGGRLHVVVGTSGTISGTYHADITFTRGSLYVEKTIDKTFTITLGGDGTCHIDMGGRRFRADIGLGTILR